MRAPSTNPITLRFGQIPNYPLNGGFHRGLDFAPGPDGNVYMTEDAIITYMPNNGNDGNAIYYYRNNYKVAFCHLHHSLVKSGQFVKVGTPIGVIGYSGYVLPSGPSGAHLHMAILQNNNFIDPLSMITGGKGADMSNFRPLSDDEIDVIHQGFFQGDRAPKSVHDQWRTKDPIDFSKWILDGGTWKDRVKQLRSAAGIIDPVVLDKANRYDQIRQALN